MWFALDDVRIANDSGSLHTRGTIDGAHIISTHNNTKRRRKFIKKKKYRNINGEFIQYYIVVSVQNVQVKTKMGITSRCFISRVLINNVYNTLTESCIHMVCFFIFSRSDVNLCDKTPVLLTPFEGGE